jgi:hypothetical protein
LRHVGQVALYLAIAHADNAMSHSGNVFLVGYNDDGVAGAMYFIK